MKKIALILACLILSGTAHAQIDTELDSSQQMAQEERIKNDVKFNEKANFLATQYDKKKLEGIIKYNQALDKRMAERAHEEPKPELDINVNNPAEVKIYLNTTKPDTTDLIRNVPFFDK